MYRAAIGEYVRNRLARTENCFRLPVKDADLYVVRDFLTPDECDGLIAQIDARSQPSGVLADEPDPTYRTSYSANMDPHDPLVQSIEDKLWRLMGIQREHGETIQGQRYAVGQEFKPHHDFFHTTQRYWLDEQRTGGQRTWTAMMFLNDPEAGGQTYFPEIDVRITPRQGNLFTWNNMDAEGEPNRLTLHQGMPVLAGFKYIITKWYRERPWGHQPEDVPIVVQAPRG
ncbi:prolyl hydroxylase family protein [Allosphingosinicella sp.]|jgi:prolyl 4-hydroxylase|uniref:prolyl hydroxylase family protein n=1 Tax=Allosphingosinicella sp. TaxID=2823234 RepID=UPI002F15E5A5